MLSDTGFICGAKDLRDIQEVLSAEKRKEIRVQPKLYRIATGWKYEKAPSKMMGLIVLRLRGFFTKQQQSGD